LLNADRITYDKSGIASQDESREKGNPTSSQGCHQLYCFHMSNPRGGPYRPSFRSACMQLVAKDNYMVKWP
jgi:hypothetical protein